MKISLIATFLFVLLLHISANTLAQRVSFSKKNVSLREALQIINKQTGYDFVWSTNKVKADTKVSIDLQQGTLDEALKQILVGLPLQYQLNGRLILITSRSENKEEDRSKKNNAIELQERIKLIEGRITDSLGNPLTGTTINAIDKEKGTVLKSVNSNVSGIFILEDIPTSSVLEISHIGYKTLSMRAKASLGTIILQSVISSVDEVVVQVNTGYQTIAKERATGSFGYVSEDLISKRPFSSLASIINGQVAGVVADASTGFTIRGRSSLSGAGDRTPLLVVDGFPIEGGFNSINPNDVKSVSILKDAAATSIYGAKAANGVIVVTTKTARGNGKINVDYNVFVKTAGKVDLDHYMNFIDTKKQMDFEDYMFSTFKGTTLADNPHNTSNGSYRAPRSDYSALLFERERGNITQEYFNDRRQQMLSKNYKADLNKYLLRNYFSQQHNLSFGGNTEKHSYKLSFLYDQVLGSFQFNQSDKLMLSFNNQYKLSSKVNYTVNANLTSNGNKNNGLSLSQAKDVLSPWSKLVDSDGNYTRMSYQNYEPLVQQMESKLPYSSRYNLLEDTYLKDNRSESLDIRLQNELSWLIGGGFTFKPMFQYERNHTQGRTIYHQDMYAVRGFANLIGRWDAASGRYLSDIPQGGIFSGYAPTKRESFKYRAQVFYDKNFGANHSIAATLGSELISTKSDVGFSELKFGYNTKGLNYTAFDIDKDRFDIFGNAYLGNNISYEGQNIYNYTSTDLRQSYRYNERNLAMFFSGSYSYGNKYIASASFRSDASNYVAKRVRDKFSPFFSFGGRWHMDQENFLKEVYFIDKFSLRGTYGVAGNAAGKNNILALSVFSSTPPTPETGNQNAGIISGRDNDYLTWEKTFTTNIGADFEFFGGKLLGSVEWYRRLSKDLLSQVQTSQVIQSTSSVAMNLGAIRNQGIEVSLGTKIKRKDFSWTSNIVFDFNKNKVTSFNFKYTQLMYYIGRNARFVEGMPTDGFFMIRLAGVSDDGYYIQQTKDGQLVKAMNNNTNFASTTMQTIPGLNINDDNRIYYQGRLTPPQTIGITNSFDYKGFSFMAIVTGKFGHKFLTTDQSVNYSLGNNNYSRSGMELLGVNDGKLIGNILPNKINQAYALTASNLRNYSSEQVVQPADVIRLDEVFLGYTVPDNWLRFGRVIKSMSIYSQLKNAGIIWKSNKAGYDPEFIYGTLKPLKTFTFGIKVKI